MKTYQTYNNILGWLVFIFASAVYLITSEPTASFWDCGEYIATAYKLQVGHPPGAPLFQLLGRFFSLFAGSDVTLVARMVNSLSALVSGFTILFLFWSITHLAKKIALQDGEMDNSKMIVVLGSALVGSLAFTFSDSFWFSAVEGEVYAMSTFFTALVFWAILKWESVADEKHALRWLVLIAYLVGLSIGVHLLNLLAIPAITFVYYFKKYPVSIKGIFYVSILSILILAGVMYVIIPWIVNLAGLFERFFVNSIRLPFNSGTIIYFILLIGGIVAGLRFTHKRGKVILNAIILSFAFILIGYSSFLMLVIRSNANPPIDENNPENAISLLSYLNREQYGDWPIVYGAYFNAPLEMKDLNNDGIPDNYKDGKPVYTKDLAQRKYVITDSRKQSIPNYDERFKVFFPRMWNNQQESYKSGYKDWGKIKGTPIRVTTQDGKTEIINKPTLGENLRFFFTYQIGHMYMRYFMWNFAGRQNDIQGHGEPSHGNWMSGIGLFDNHRIGPQDNDKLPNDLANNKGANRFYMLPLILGLAGLIFQINKNYKDSIVVGFLFIMTGLAIVIYLNQNPYQPRERDYAFAASFMAFSIWIGLGVMAIYSFASKYINKTISGVAATLICLIAVPTVMGKEGWDDHNRAHRYTALAIAKNYLNSCEKNAIIFTNGDNDTFPLWYAQEVEGVRTDVRVVNLSLLNTDWYIDQMIRQAYDSPPVPFSLTREQVRQGTRDFVYFYEMPPIKDMYVPLRKLFDDFVGNDSDPKAKLQSYRGPLEIFPTKNFRIPVDSAKVLANGTVASKYADKIVKNIDWRLDRFGVQKNHLMVLDLLATFNWDRPIYFAITTGDDSYIGLTDYFQLEGLAYRLVPLKEPSLDGQTGMINTDIMYDNLMKKFEWGNFSNPKVYLDETNMRMTWNFRNIFARLATALIAEGKKDSALLVLDKCMEIMPESSMPFNYFTLPVAEAYYAAGATEKANVLIEKLTNIYAHNLNYYFSLKGNLRNHPYVDREKQQGLGILRNIYSLPQKYQQEELYQKALKIFENYYNIYTGKPLSPTEQGVKAN